MVLYFSSCHRAPDTWQSQRVLCNVPHCQLWLCPAPALEEPREKFWLFNQPWSSAQVPPWKVKSIWSEWKDRRTLFLEREWSCLSAPTTSRHICGCLHLLIKMRLLLCSSRREQRFPDFDWNITRRSSHRSLIFIRSSTGTKAILCSLKKFEGNVQIYIRLNAENNLSNKKCNLTKDWCHEELFSFHCRRWHISGSAGLTKQSCVMTQN